MSELGKNVLMVVAIGVIAFVVEVALGNLQKADVAGGVVTGAVAVWLNQRVTFVRPKGRE